MSLEFHLRNLDQDKRWFGIYHAGCAEAPWHYGVPGCWWTVVPHNPFGGHHSVYVPSDWVVHFGTWFDLIINGLELIESIGVFIASEGDDADAVIDAVADALNVTKDAVKGAIQKGHYDIDKLAKNAHKSFDRTCQSIDMEPSDVKQLAADMGVGGNWFFLAGASYQNHIFKDSKLNDGHGWVVLTKEAGADSPQYLANHAFVQSGHIIQAFDSRHADKLWNSTGD